jgi:glycosyltransferase involved in cell wall biosynthesis
MPRIGYNPSRGQETSYRPARVTAAVLTYLPNQDGYFRDRLDVSRLCIESILANTQGDFDLLVFDNGSCPPLVDYLRGLHQRGLIDYLLLSSHNIGKIAALQMIFRLAPGEIVAYTDDDIFFLPGWLEAHLKLIDTFPRVGAVTGLYIRPRVNYAVQSTMTFAQDSQVELTRGRFIPRSWEEEYINNSNRTWDSYAKEIEGLEDIALSYQGVEALVSAHHFQFVAPRQVMQQALPQEWTGQLMGQMGVLEKKVDELGYLRLSTRQQTVRLLGNSLSPEMVEKAGQLGLGVKKASAFNKPASLFTRLVRLPGVERLVRFFYNRLYDILNH